MPKLCHINLLQGLPRRGILGLLAPLLFWGSLARADTTCSALRDIAQQANPTYIVRCANGTQVEITAAQYHTNTGKDSNFGQFCPDTGWRSAGEEGRWQTASGFPEVCDVFSLVPRQPVRESRWVYFLHSNNQGEEEIDTRVHALVYDGNVLVNFQPPVPGILVGP